MKRIGAILLLSLASTAYALPNCPSDQNQRYDNCFGTYIWGSGPNKGDKYVGEWKDDKKHGQGTYTSANAPNKGDKYVGEYKDDKRHGQGTYTWGDDGPNKGDKYVGELKDGNYHGQGTYTFASGAKYVGEHKDDKKHGQGTYTYSDGTKDSGYWMNNEYVPDICETMGLSKGTSEFGQCVLKLIDKF